MKYEKFLNDCYNLYTIKTNKFKSCHLEIVFRTYCTKENVTYLALLFDMLMENSKDYPSRKLLARKEEDLYNTNIYAVSSRVGKTLLSNVVVDFLDPKYMETGTLEEIISLTSSLIFNPNVENDEFDESTFEMVKSRLLKEIEGLKEDPKQLSILDALSSIDKNNPRCFNASGDASVLKEITPKKLYNFYKKVLEESLIDVYVIGNLEGATLNKLIKKYMHLTSIKTDNLEAFLEDIPNKKYPDVKKSNVLTQTNVVQIYSFKNLSDYETNTVMPIFNLLWGSGSLESKLYKTVRGENSLCYNINTFYQKYDKVIVLHTAIDGENYNKTIKLIKSCLNEMKDGCITEEELENVKNILINSLNLIYDSPSRLIDNYLFKNILGLPEIDVRIQEFKRVSIEDLVKLSKKINLILNYRIGE